MNKKSEINLTSLIIADLMLLYTIIYNQIIQNSHKILKILLFVNSSKVLMRSIKFPIEKESTFSENGH